MPASCAARRATDAVGNQWRRQGLPGRLTRLGGVAVVLALDVEQGVNALHGLKTDRRRRRRRLVLRRPARAVRDVGQHEELSPCVGPACRFEDRAWLSSGLVELAVAAIGVGLQQPGISIRLALRMRG